MGTNKNKKFWVITDTHLLHAKTVEYCNRPVDFDKRIYKGLQQIDKNDTLIHLGDVAANKREAEAHERFIMPLECTKILVRGNHDKRSDNWYGNHGWDFVCRSFRNVFFGKNILFSHHPKQWDGYYDYTISGHFHNITCHNWEPELVKNVTYRHILLACEHTCYHPVNIAWLVRKAKYHDELLKEYTDPIAIANKFNNSFQQDRQRFHFTKDVLVLGGRDA